MADLTQKFFDTGLSQAEQAQLEAELEASPELASAFSERALAEYRAMGLPEPTWRRALPWKRFVWPLALLLGTCMAWSLFGPGHPARPDLGLDGGSFKNGGYAEPSEEAPAPQKPAPAEAKKVPLAEAMPKVNDGRKAPKFNGTVQGTRLGVVVKQAENGFAVVSVRDSAGRELRNLYQGQLGPGEHRFEWDGRLNDGKAAAPGTYSIAVRRGGSTVEKEITIKNGVH